MNNGIDLKSLPPRLTTEEAAAVIRKKPASLRNDVALRRGLGKVAIKAGGRLLWRREDVLAYIGESNGGVA